MPVRSHVEASSTGTDCPSAFPVADVRNTTSRMADTARWRRAPVGQSRVEIVVCRPGAVRTVQNQDLRALRAFPTRLILPVAVAGQQFAQVQVACVSQERRERGASMLNRTGMLTRSVCYFGRKRIGALRSAHDVSGDCAGLSMKSAAILAPHGLNALTL